MEGQILESVLVVVVDGMEQVTNHAWWQRDGTCTEKDRRKEPHGRELDQHKDSD
jgi:hypothetical protein